MRRIVANDAQILLGGWYGAGKNRCVDAYGASNVTYRKTVGPWSGGGVPPPTQHATITIRLSGAGLPVTTTLSGQPAGAETVTTSSAMFGWPPVGTATGGPATGSRVAWQ